jgi:hypothetical protein
MAEQSKYQRLIDWFYILVLLLVCLKLCYGVTNLLEIVFADESVSLFKGYQFKASFLFRDGFIYHLWYKFLSFFIPDAIYLYCYNYVILIVLNAVLMYVLSRKTGRKPFFSFLFAVIFLISSINIFTWPFVTRFVVSIILLTIILVLSVKKNRAKYMVVLVGLSLLVYVRPEFILSLILFSAVFLIISGYRYYKSVEKRRGYLFILIFTLLLSIFVVVIKNPATHNRSIIAFGQHYLNNVRQWEANEGRTWKGTQWRQAMITKFKTDQSLFTAFFNNPGEMIKHGWTNAKKIPYKTLYAHYPFTLTAYSRPVKIVIKWAIIGLYLISLFNFIRHIRTRYREKKGDVFHLFDIDDKIFYFFLLILLVPSITSLSLIFPRDHYIFIFFVLLYLLFIKNLPHVPPVPKYGMVIAPLAALILVYFIPWRVSGTHGVLPGTPTHICSHLKQLQLVKNVPVHADVHFLGTLTREWKTHRSFRKYIEIDSPSLFTYTFHQLEQSPSPDGSHDTRYFEKLINEKNINMILVDKKLLNHKQLESNPEFRDLIIDYRGKNWTPFEIPDCSDYLLVKNDILSGRTMRGVQ